MTMIEKGLMYVILMIIKTGKEKLLSLLIKIH